MGKLGDFFAEGQLRKYPRGQILLYQSESTDNTFFIKSGHVKVYDISSKGTEKLLLILGPGDMYPAVWTFREKERLLYFYEAISDVEIRVIPRSKFLHAIDRDHEFSNQLLRYFVDVIKDLALRIETLDASSAKYKVAQVMSYLLKRHSGRKDGSFTAVSLPVTHQMVASMAGTSRETASTIIKEFEESSVIKQSYKKMSINAKKLSSLLSSE